MLALRSSRCTSQHQRIFGVDLTRIPGIDVVSAQTVLSELGPDLSAWATEKHFTSWLGLAPKPRISGGKVLGHDREPMRNRVAEVLRLAATTLLKSASYLGARYRYLRMTRGAAVATKAMARQLACLIFRTIHYGQEWVDRGAAEFEQKRRQREPTTKGVPTRLYDSISRPVESIGCRVSFWRVAPKLKLAPRLTLRGQ